MKLSSFLRIGCAAACFALLAVLGGCAASSTSVPTAIDTPESESSGSSVLADGELRILYSSDISANGSIVFCGDQPIYYATGSETLSLLQDTLSGETNYYWRRWSDNASPSRRCCGLYDRTGAQLLVFDEDYTASLTGQTLVLYSSSYEDIPDAYGTCRVIDLATGQELPVPENAYNCLVYGDALVFRCYTRPEGLGENDYDDDSYYHTSVLVTDRSGTVLLELPHCIATEIYSSSNTDPDWVQLDVYEPNFQRTESILYAPATGEQLTGFEQVCGEGIFCFSTQNGYQLVDFSCPERTVLGTFDAQVEGYAPGVAVLWRSSGGDYYYELHDLTTGEVCRLSSYSSSERYLAAYLSDNTLRFYDRSTGKRVLDTTVPDIDHKNTYISFESDEVLRMHCYSGISATHFYDAQGLVSGLEEAFGQYRSVYYLTDAADGSALYVGSYPATGSNRTLFDLLDAEGKVLVSGLSNCYVSYNRYRDDLPPGVFVAQKGFFYGWMDASGNWVWCRSIFSSPAAEDPPDIYY